MKFQIAIIVLTLAFSLFLKAGSDSLVIKFKDNHVEKIDVSLISRIQFENITGVGRHRGAQRAGFDRAAD